MESVEGGFGEEGGGRDVDLAGEEDEEETEHFSFVGVECVAWARICC